MELILVLYLILPGCKDNLLLCQDKLPTAMSQNLSRQLLNPYRLSCAILHMTCVFTPKQRLLYL